MTSIQASTWAKLPVSLAELCIDTTLRCGQTFRWKKLRKNEWSCAFHGQILSVKQDATHLHYRSSPPNLPSLGKTSVTGSISEYGDTEPLVRHYFNLSQNLSNLYDQWSSVDPNFKRRAPKFTGVRILKQDAWEALLGFICSSNNNIVRISQMVNNLCLHYGPLIGHIDGHPFHDFPTPEALAVPGVEARLRELGFGYRAKYIAQTAVIVTEERPKGWLQSLSNPESLSQSLDQDAMPNGGRPGYRQAHEELLKLQGVGPKVADCVCLMGLGWSESVPVDTHVWQIAQRDYKFGKGKHKSLTKATYDTVGDHFRSLWGKEAGWAHSVLFAADLRTFSERLTTKIEVDAEEVMIQMEDDSLLQANVAVKREYILEVNEELDVSEKSSLLVETPRSQRAKRRRP